MLCFSLGDGLIQKNEFIEAMAMKWKSDDQLKDDLRMSFKIFDKDGNG